MIARFPVSATLITLITAAACSKPDSTRDERPESTSARSRDIQLVDAAATEAKVVSDIESGRAPAIPTLRVGKAVQRAAIREKAPIDLTTPIRMAVVSERASETETVALVAAEMPAVGGAAGRGPSPALEDATAGASRGPSDWSREPTVIIRGGMGSPRDDCKIHGTGGLGGGGGIAINSIAPPFRGRASPPRLGQVRIR